MQLAVNGPGRVATDPEMGTTKKRQVFARFRVACRRDGQTDEQGKAITDFYTCVCYGSQAEFATKYVASGDLVAIRGRLSINEWTDRQGVKHRDPEITLDRVEKLNFDTPRQPGANEMGPAPEQAPAPLAAVPESSGDASVAGTSIPPFQAPPAAPAHADQDDPYAVAETAAA